MIVSPFPVPQPVRAATSASRWIVLTAWLLLAASRSLPTPGADSSPSLFPNGVAAGDVTSRSVVLWTRLLEAGTVRLVLATNDTFLPILATTELRWTKPAVPLKIELSNLAPGVTYHYRFEAAQGQWAAGKFRTPAQPGQARGVRFGVSGDWQGDLAPYPSVSNAPGRDLDFFATLGDTIYADVASPAVPASQARTIDEFRAKHSEAYSARLGANSLADLRATTAWFAVPDDHEVINDFAGGAAPETDNRFPASGSYINESELYRVGMQAFQEFNPIRSLAYDTPTDARTHRKPKFYRAQTFGNDAAIFLLDLRSFRDAPLPGVTNPLDTEGAKAFGRRTFDLDPATGQPAAARTVLGAAQLAALKSDLLQAKDRNVMWKFVLLGEPIQHLGFVDAADRFEGYARERSDLLRFITENQIRNVVFVSADIHGTVVNNVNDQAGPEQPLVPTGTFEVVTGAIAHDKPFGPTAFDTAAEIRVLPGVTLLDGLLDYVRVADRKTFDALPVTERDQLFKRIMDVQLNAIQLDSTGLEGSDIQATLEQGGYIAAHTYGWTEFEIDPATHRLTVTTYGIEPYSATDVTPDLLHRVPQVVSRFVVVPRPAEAGNPALRATLTSGSVQVSWPGSAEGFVLQRRAGGFSAAWADVSEPSALVDGRFQLTLPVTGTEAYYRLRKQL